MWDVSVRAELHQGRGDEVTVICAGSVRVAHPLFQEDRGGSIPTSALQLRFERIPLRRAIELNAVWHSRLPRVVFSNIIRTVRHVCYGAECGGVYYAVAIWTNPVARLLPQHTWLELRRLAIASDAPKNTASRMLGWMVRDIRAEWSELDTLVSYQDTAVHTGTIYKAAGWNPTTINPDGEWSRPNRFRKAAQSAAPKQRWELSLQKRELIEC